MKTRIGQAVVAAVVAVGLNANTHAFMAVETQQPAEVQITLADTVEAFRQEIASGETSCNDMLKKLNVALEEIDAKLDAGVANEEEYLAARDELAKMRYDLECLAEKLTQVIVDPPNVGGNLNSFGTNVSPVGGGSFNVGPGAVSSGSSFGSLMAVGGIVGGTVGAAAASDNDNPGAVGSPSGTN